MLLANEKKGLQIGYTACIHVSLADMTVKDAGLRIRVSAPFRQAFKEACDAEGLIASEVIRAFMEDFTQRYQSGKQTSLFTNSYSQTIKAEKK